MEHKHKFHKFGFNPDGFIHYEEDELDDFEIEDEFSGDFE